MLDPKYDHAMKLAQLHSDLKKKTMTAENIECIKQQQGLVLQIERLREQLLQLQQHDSKLDLQLRESQLLTRALDIEPHLKLDTVKDCIQVLQQKNWRQRLEMVSHKLKELGYELQESQGQAKIYNEYIEFDIILSNDM